MPRQIVDLRRPAPSFKQKENFLILHEEGAYAEYLAWVRRVLDHQHATLEPIPLEGSVQEAIDHAIELRSVARKHSAPFTSIWCALDGRLHPVSESDLEFAKIKRIRIVVCDPSFESWLALHFLPKLETTTAFPDLSTLMPGYAGSLRDLENHLFNKFDDARARAVEWESESGVRLNLYELVDVMRESLRANKGLADPPRI